jgi:tetratricopeptide (TPR) repeat protein
VETLRRAVQLAPDQAGLHNNLGYALMRAGREQEARTALLQALALQPGYVRAQANLRRLEDAAVAHQAPTPAAPPAPLMAENNMPGVANVGTGTTEASRTAEPAPDTPAASPALPASPGAAAAPAALPATATAPTPTPTPTPAVEIANGNGVEGMAACMAEALRSLGAVGKTRLRNALPYDTATTVVRYRAGHAQVAQALARQLPGGAPAVAGLDRADSLDLRIVLGHDLRTSGPCARPG